MTVQWMPIACQGNRLSTVSLECLLECLSHLASAYQPASSFVLEKSTHTFNLTSIRRTFPPLLGPTVPCGGCLGRCLIHWKCAILFLQDTVLFYLFVWSPLNIIYPSLRYRYIYNKHRHCTNPRHCGLILRSLLWWGEVDPSDLDLWTPKSIGFLGWPYEVLGVTIPNIHTKFSNHGAHET